MLAWLAGCHFYSISLATVVRNGQPFIVVHNRLLKSFSSRLFIGALIDFLINQQWYVFLLPRHVIRPGLSCSSSSNGLVFWISLSLIALERSFCVMVSLFMFSSLFFFLFFVRSFINLGELDCVRITIFSFSLFRTFFNINFDSKVSFRIQLGCVMLFAHCQCYFDIRTHTHQMQQIDDDDDGHAWNACALISIYKLCAFPLQSASWRAQVN